VLRGSENWTINARDARRITAAEMKHMRRTVGYTWTEYTLKKRLLEN
jgi:ABC-type ATPase involved in cell division